MNNLIPIKHNNDLILTTEQLADIYETDVNNIKNNYNRNKERFLEGKHFYFLKGEELKEFKNCVTDSDLVNKHTRSLYLWTERGASRHCKILDTDKAWDRFDELEETYFRVKEQPKIRQTLPETFYYFDGVQYTTVKDISAMYSCPVSTVRSYVYKNLKCGVDYLLLQGKKLMDFRYQNPIFKAVNSLYIITMSGLDKINKYLFCNGYEQQSTVINTNNANNANNEILNILLSKGITQHWAERYLSSSDKEKDIIFANLCQILLKQSKFIEDILNNASSMSDDFIKFMLNNKIKLIN